MTLKKTYIYGIFTLFSHVLSAASFSSLEEDYTPKYCLQLEAVYGKGMMAEGGAEAIEHMFDQIPIEKTRALDIGSGLGGVALYLAEKHGMKVTGLDVNPWLVSESTKRIPEFLKDKVDFFLSASNSNWSFSDESFDVIYSKGVLTHLETKDEIFQECRRILKSGGLLVINDWLSSAEKKWGENITKLMELEPLALFPENESGYTEQLKRNGFTIISIRDDSMLYERFNHEIAEQLRNPEARDAFLSVFNDKELEAAPIGYDAVARAIEVGELRVLQFVARKD